MVHLMILKGELDDMIVDARPCFFKDMSDENRMMDPLNDTFFYSSQLRFTCSKSTKEKLEKGANMFKICSTLTIKTPELILLICS